MTRRRAFLAAVATIAIAALLAYLREPSWLAGIESGFRGWNTGADGVRYRWTDGHASFFVPAASATLIIPARVTFDRPGDPPVLVSISIDDRLADRFELRDDRWLTRRLRRIDIRVDRVRDGNRGIQLGEVEQR